jgi:hypothetical protein
MTETFLILLAAGVMLAGFISNPRDVTLHWLRLAGIIALAVASLSVYFFLRRPDWRAVRPLAFYGVSGVAILGQLGFVQVAWHRTQRALAGIAVIAGIGTAVALASAGTSNALWIIILSCAGVAAMVGLALMDMLLGHAYLTASKMTMKPFRRLNASLAIVTAARSAFAMGLTMALLHRHPIEFFWDRFGILVITRWLVGLAVPAVFIYMTHDCIKRRATQSATGILYVAGLLVFVGELAGLYLTRETGLPF